MPTLECARRTNKESTHRKKESINSQTGWSEYEFGGEQGGACGRVRREEREGRNAIKSQSQNEQQQQQRVYEQLLWGVKTVNEISYKKFLKTLPGER